MLPGPPTVCPSCGREALQATSDGWTTNFLCHVCGRCWRYELGYVSEVDPGTCPGCADRDICMARVQFQEQVVEN